jgi:Arc/MetJ-type ribon-helix-helix transcriptional regulator
MKSVTVRLDDRSYRELEQAAEELGESTSELVRHAIHLVWFTTIQERMRRKAAETASAPAEGAQAAQRLEWDPDLVGDRYKDAVAVSTGWLVTQVTRVPMPAPSPPNASGVVTPANEDVWFG